MVCYYIEEKENYPLVYKLGHLFNNYRNDDQSFILSVHRYYHEIQSDIFLFLLCYCYRHVDDRDHDHAVDVDDQGDDDDHLDHGLFLDHYHLHQRTYSYGRYSISWNFSCSRTRCR